ALSPVSALKRDLILFRAGQASASRRGWLWPATTVMMATAAAVLLVKLAVKEEPQVIERIVYVAVQTPVQPIVVAKEPHSTPPAVESEPSPPDPSAYWVLREQIFQGGVESLPRPEAVDYSAGPPQTLGSLMMGGINEKEF